MKKTQRVMSENMIKSFQLTFGVNSTIENIISLLFNNIGMDFEENNGHFVSKPHTLADKIIISTQQSNMLNTNNLKKFNTFIVVIINDGKMKDRRARNKSITRAINKLFEESKLLLEEIV